MRLIFAYFLIDDAGSAQDVRNYVRAAEDAGHEIRMYGSPRVHSSVPHTNDLRWPDAVIFICEWTTKLRYGDNFDFLRLLESVPRRKRVLIDCDGNYNDAINVEGDYNHRDPASSATWVDTCDLLADRIFQPSCHPRRQNVQTFFFHGYDPAWERPLELRNRQFGMIYVGHSKFRWGPMLRVLRAVEPVRERVGRIGIIGHGWDELPSWASSMNMEDAYHTDPQYMRQMGVEIMAPIASDRVIDWMSQAVFNPVIYRPLFSHLGFVTCRTFETVGAGTIPLFALDPAYVQEIYGECASELILPTEGPEQKVQDLFRRPEHYAGIVRQIRRHMNEKHSYAARLRELIRIVED
jgi:glycosyl transferase family 1